MDWGFIMKNKVEISKIAIQLNGKKVELTVDEAKELHRQLDSMFGVQYIPTIPQVWGLEERINPNTPQYKVTC